MRNFKHQAASRAGRTASILAAGLVVIGWGGGCATRTTQSASASGGAAATTASSSRSRLSPAEVAMLRQELGSLRTRQAAMAREIEDIKDLLAGRSPRPPKDPVDLVLELGDAFYRGDKTAKVTVVEFSDYQCPVCSRSLREILPDLEKDYIATGKVKYVFRDYPLEQIHKYAFKAAEGARCAGEQGKFWEMHDRLFGNQRALRAADLPKHAEAIGLEGAKFQECLDSGKYGAKIRDDLVAGKVASVRGTPTFLIGVTDPSGERMQVKKIVRGIGSYNGMKFDIEAVLRKAK